jgi:hypothetical protein
VLTPSQVSVWRWRDATLLSEGKGWSGLAPEVRAPTFERGAAASGLCRRQRASQLLALREDGDHTEHLREDVLSRYTIRCSSLAEVDGRGTLLTVQVYGVAWNPFKANTFVTHGVKHLKIWNRHAQTEPRAKPMQWKARNGVFEIESAPTHVSLRARWV